MRPTLAQVQATLKKFIGDQLQTPPIFSALKINGQPAYKLARAGKTPELKPRPITIHSLDLISYNYPELKIQTNVSSGTYIRTLAEDIGKELKTGAHLTALRRAKIGKHNLKAAQTLQDFGIIN